MCRPRNTGFAFAGSMRRARRSRETIASRSSASMPSREEGLVRTLNQQNFFRAVHFLELHFDDLAVGGLHNAAHEGGLDGQLAMAAINQAAKLHAARPAVVKERVERGARGAAGVEHVV